MDQTTVIIALAGLLHDVGKFMQRAEVPLSAASKQMENTICPVFEGRYSHKHVLWSSEFFDFFDGHPVLAAKSGDDSLSALACYHHNPSSTLQKLVQLADCLSSASDRMHDSENHGRDAYKKERLHSIFEYLRISDDNKPQAMHRYELDCLDCGAKNLFPSNMNNLSPLDGKPIVTNYAKLWGEFIHELQTIKTTEPEQFIAPLLSLLEKYTWCIPSSTIDRPDISLYDHARTTAAIAAALYQWQKNGSGVETLTTTSSTQQPFLLVAGDISGIQNYLFNIKNIGVGGATKRLRARSFMISSLIEAASHILLKEFGMPLTNLIISSGGKFYLLLPALQNADQRIATKRRELNNWLLKHRNGELILNIATVRCSCYDFQQFNTVLKKLNNSLQQEKSKPFYGVLTTTAGWDEERFVVKNIKFEDDESLCQACGHFPGAQMRDDGAVICGYCADDAKLGRELSNAVAISFMADTTGSYPLFEHSFTVHKMGEQARSNAYLVGLLNNWDLTDHSGPVRSRYVANHIPRFDDDLCRYCNTHDCKEKPNAVAGQPRFFQCMAEASRGRKALGVLKADVDNLGLIFINGFLSDKEKSISRIATLSRMLDSFFTGRIDALLRDEFPDLYTVYAGGDDLLLLGPWSMMLKFAHRLREEFSQFTCANPDFTLSAGMALAKPRLPILNVVQGADELLDQAKHEAAPGEHQPKNQLATLGDCFKWSKAERLQHEADKLAGWYEGRTGNLSSATVRQLLNSARQYREFAKTGNTRLLSFVPMLSYTINRNINANEGELVQWLYDLTDLKSQNLHHLVFIANYSLTMNRS